MPFFQVKRPIHHDGKAYSPDGAPNERAIELDDESDEFDALEAAGAIGDEVAAPIEEKRTAKAAAKAAKASKTDAAAGDGDVKVDQTKTDTAKT